MASLRSWEGPLRTEDPPVIRRAIPAAVPAPGRGRQPSSWTGMDAQKTAHVKRPQAPAALERPSYRRSCGTRTSTLTIVALVAKSVHRTAIVYVRPVPMPRRVARKYTFSASTI